MTIHISKKAWGNNKITPDGRVVHDEKAAEAKLDVSTRAARRAGGSKKKIRLNKPGKRS